ncbi:hypothetical protein EVAR_46928_1 [Eumeta japonica]|uniref:Uncharacterized protein n=1 Tax=Eumeta variegata TaxID=151549 RepID=A0A4C1XYB1_EUMVA|nr:hypothetical protein EVAR_46928_1 [Eumeta japonica]
MILSGRVTQTLQRSGVLRMRNNFNPSAATRPSFYHVCPTSPRRERENFPRSGPSMRFSEINSKGSEGFYCYVSELIYARVMLRHTLRAKRSMTTVGRELCRRIGGSPRSVLGNHGTFLSISCETIAGSMPQRRGLKDCYSLYSPGSLGYFCT